MKALEIIKKRIKESRSRFDVYRNGDLVDNPISISVELNLLNSEANIFVDGRKVAEIEDFESIAFDDKLNELEALTKEEKDSLLSEYNDYI